MDWKGIENWGIYDLGAKKLRRFLPYYTAFARASLMEATDRSAILKPTYFLGIGVLGSKHTQSSERAFPTKSFVPFLFGARVPSVPKEENVSAKRFFVRTLARFGIFALDETPFFLGVVELVCPIETFTPSSHTRLDDLDAEVLFRSLILTAVETFRRSRDVVVFE